MSDLAIVVSLLPMVGAVFAFVVGKIDKRFAFWSAEIVGITLFLITLVMLREYSEPVQRTFTWFSLGSWHIPFGIYIDKLSLAMLLVVTGLGALDIHFAHDYMKEEKDQSRYYAKVLFFIGGMILLVSAKDLVSLFVGWEFMGLASYLLISFWHEKKEAADAGVSAFLFTRFGDVFLFAAIGLLFYFAGTLDLVALNQLALQGKIDTNVSYIIAIFIFIAAIGKSGQFPLFPWLMRAMEGPTTVSALIHGATMVNSGIYIVARLFDFYVASEALIVVAAFGAVSAFIGATSALVQKELKKVLAYSTMSHLSLAFIGLGAGSLAAGMTHLLNHAVFKALLFLCVGAIIMSASHVKDMWRFGGLKAKMPLVAFFMGLGALSLSGIPPFSGFYSKDAVIALTLANPQTNGILFALTLIAGVLSVAYIGRVWFATFSGTPRDKDLYEKTKKPSFFWITLPLAIMGTATLAMGFFQENIVKFVSVHDVQEPHVKGLAVTLLGIIGLLAFLVYFYYSKRLELTQKIAAQPLMQTIHKVLFNGYFIEFFIYYFTKNFVVGGIAKTINWIDTNVIDASVNVSVPLLQKIRKMVAKTYTGFASDNAGAMTIGLLLILVALFVGGAL